MDSSLLVSASLVSHNIVVPLKPGVSEAAKVRTARAGVILFDVLAYVLALHAEGVYHLAEQASAFGSAGIFVIVAFGLFSPFGGPASAVAALIVGTLVWVVGSYLLGLPFAHLAALATSASAYLIVGLIGGARSVMRTA